MVVPAKSLLLLLFLWCLTGEVVPRAHELHRFPWLARGRPWLGFERRRHTVGLRVEKRGFPHAAVGHLRHLEEEGRKHHKNET